MKNRMEGHGVEEEGFLASEPPHYLRVGSNHCCLLSAFFSFFFSIADQFSMAHNIAVNINGVIFWHINVYIQSAGCGSGLINSIS